MPHGGWAGELNIVAYHPQTEHLVHIEPSIDAHSWKKREERFEKKFRLGREYIYEDVFSWLSPETPLHQIAMLVTSSRKDLCGATVVSIDEFMRQIKDEIQQQGIMAKNAIPEEYDLLRTIQMAINGYYKIV